MSYIDYLDEAITRFSEAITERLREEETLVSLLDTIPGVSWRTVEVFLADVGSDMSCLPTANHLASWAGMCPGNHESAGKRKSGRTRKV